MSISNMSASSVYTLWIRQENWKYVSLYSSHLGSIQTPKSRSDRTWIIIQISFQLSILCRLPVLETIKKVPSHVVSIRKWVKCDLVIMISKVFRLLSHSEIYCKIVHDDLQSLDECIQSITVRIDDFFGLYF